ncbi:hypothetical protein BDV12DRAFT_44251 [Aspergillus spectabilis]
MILTFLCRVYLFQVLLDGTRCLLFTFTYVPNSNQHQRAVMVVGRLRRQRTGPCVPASSFRDNFKDTSPTELALTELQRRILKDRPEQSRRESVSVTWILRRLGPEHSRRLTRFARCGVLMLLILEIIHCLLVAIYPPSIYLWLKGRQESQSQSCQGSHS